MDLGAPAQVPHRIPRDPALPDDVAAAEGNRPDRAHRDGEHTIPGGTADTDDLAFRSGVEDGWPTNIFSSTGEVLGVFEVGFSTPRLASSSETRCVEMAAHVASIAIERTRAEQARRESEELFRSLTETVSAGIYIYQGSSFLYFNSAFRKHHWIQSPGVVVYDDLEACPPRQS
jgi:PAS domain-containing protein